MLQVFTDRVNDLRNILREAVELLDDPIVINVVVVFSNARQIRLIYRLRYLRRQFVHDLAVFIFFEFVVLYSRTSRWYNTTAPSRDRGTHD